MYSIGVDIGGTSVKLGAVNKKNEVIVFTKIKVFKDDNPEILSMFIVFFDFAVNYIKKNYDIKKHDVNKYNFNKYDKYDECDEYDKYENNSFSDKDNHNKNFIKLTEEIVEEFYNKKGYLKLRNGFITVKYDNIYNRLIKCNFIINKKPQGSLDIVGIAAPGFPDDISKKVIGGSPNLPELTNGSFGKHLPYKFHIINDANAQGHYFNEVAEGKNFKNFVVLGLGTGIGGSIIINNKVYEGKNGWAAELGHVAINFDTNKKCKCGSIGGCSEMYGSVRSMIDRIGINDLNGEQLWDIYINHINKNKLNINKNNVGKKDSNKNKDTNRYINRKINKSINIDINKNINKDIRIVVEPWLKSLAALSGSMINILNPEAIIFSGGIIGNRPEIVKFIKEKAKHFCFETMYKEVSFIAAKNTNYSGIIGAVIYSHIVN